MGDKEISLLKHELYKIYARKSVVTILVFFPIATLNTSCIKSSNYYNNSMKAKMIKEFWEGITK